MLEILIAILMGSVKFALTFPLAVFEFKFSFFETVLWVNLGGMLGVFFFGYLSKKIIRLWNRLFKPGVRILKADYKKRKNKKVFTRKNRRIVKIKQNYGLLGIAVTTPVLLSIPVGAFLVVRYYRSNTAKFLVLVASNILWSLIYTYFYMFWKDLLTI